MKVTPPTHIAALLPPLTLPLVCHKAAASTDMLFHHQTFSDMSDWLGICFLSWHRVLLRESSHWHTTSEDAFSFGSCTQPITVWCLPLFLFIVSWEFYVHISIAKGTCDDNTTASGKWWIIIVFFLQMSQLMNQLATSVWKVFGGTLKKFLMKTEKQKNHWIFPQKIVK